MTLLTINLQTSLKVNAVHIDIRGNLTWSVPMIGMDIMVSRLTFVTHEIPWRRVYVD